MNLDDLFAGVTVPGWAIAAGAVAVVLLSLMMVMRPRADYGGGSGLGTLAQLAMVAVVAGAAYFGLKQFEDNARFAERRVLEERAAGLFAQASQPGSVLGCLNAAVTPILDEACEKVIFAEPQRLASAIGMTAERIAFLSDATNFATRDPAFVDRFDHLRKSLEADPFGLVAHVFSTEHKCIVDSCTRYRLLKDTSKIQANLSGGKFDALLAKYSPNWVSAKASINTSAVPAIPPVHTIGGVANEAELPRANTAAALPEPTGEASTAPVALPATAPNPQPSPAAAAKKKAPAKSAPISANAKKGKNPPEPVGGLPRVTARGSNPPDEDDDNQPAPTQTPPAAVSPRAPSR